jgi:hypothetical protein
MPPVEILHPQLYPRNATGIPAAALRIVEHLNEVQNIAA